MKSLGEDKTILLPNRLQNICSYNAVYPSSAQDALELCQIFAVGTTHDDCKKQFLEEFNSGSRDLKHLPKRVRVMLCGENNILTIPKGNQPFRLPTNTAWSWDYDVLLNPTHDSYRRWNEPGKRYNHWSGGGRSVLYTTNTFLGWGTAMRVYRDGKMILDGNLKETDEFNKYVDETNWRMVTINI